MIRTLLGFFILVSSSMAIAHPGFVDLSEVCPGIQVELNYASTQNFTGEVVPGYHAQKALMAKAPAMIVCQVQEAALRLGYRLKIFDSYRPAKAVAFFLEWAQRAESNLDNKEIYYPKYTRQQILDLGFIARRSSHSKGSAIDLTLVSLKSGEEINMGTPFDYFDELSHTESKEITVDQKANRRILRTLMESHGFKNFSQEWWHYSFRPEPFPDQYFDFDIE